MISCAGIPVLPFYFHDAPLPDRYFVAGWGGCMAPVMPPGKGLWLFTATEPAEPGDFACIWLRRNRESLPPFRDGIFRSGHQARLKVLVARTDDGGLRTLSINPPSIWKADPAYLVAVHKMVAFYGEDGKARSAADLIAELRPQVQALASQGAFIGLAPSASHDTCRAARIEASQPAGSILRKLGASGSAH